MTDWTRRSFAIYKPLFARVASYTGKTTSIEDISRVYLIE